MNKSNSEIPVKMYARMAGVLYLVIILCGMVSEVVIRARLVVKGDAVATVSRIMGSETLFRTGFALDAIMIVSDVAIAVIFYMLLKPVSRTLSLTAAVFRLTQAAVLGGNLLHYFAPMVLLEKSSHSASLGDQHLQSMVMFYLDLHRHGYDLGLIFFGVSCLVLGYLLIRSELFPGILGVGLMGAGVVYLAGSFALFLFPGILPVIQPLYLIPLVAELSLCIWLLVKGVRLESS